LIKHAEKLKLMEKYEEALRDRELISEQETVDILKRFERKKKICL